MSRRMLDWMSDVRDESEKLIKTVIFQMCQLFWCHTDKDDGPSSISWPTRPTTAYADESALGDEQICRSEGKRKKTPEFPDSCGDRTTATERRPAQKRCTRRCDNGGERTKHSHAMECLKNL